MSEVEKEYNNVFRFSLHQGNVLLAEKKFDADQFNPFTRYSIDVRDILPRAITKMQKTLSKRSYDCSIEIGCDEGTNEMKYYDLYDYNQKIINSYPKERRDELVYNPEYVVQHIEHKTIRGVPCKIGLYINENPIVEREFFVDGFNSIARYSVDVLDAVVEVADQIYLKIKNSDVTNMWDDYDLINQRGMTINQIRELSPYNRGEILRRLRRK